MTRVKWVLILIPFLIGLAIDLSLVWILDVVPIAYARADLGSIALLAGLVLTLFAGVIAVYQTKAKQEQLDFQNRLQNQAADERRRFLSRLDHELKNPLTAIRAGLANVSSSPSTDSRQEALASVEAQALRLSRLAADLRKLAELETRPLETSTVDLNAVLHETFAIAQDQPESTDRKLTLTLPRAPWPLPKVSGDTDLLFLAIHNLLDNALKFTRPGDTIELRSFEDGSSVVIEVADTGPGIQEDDIPHVWEELYRGQSARGIPGSGLGLALVKAITDRHNGQVSIRSREGQGTVFSIKLPIR
jgi:two-component system OmpR family sensor kinase